MYTFVPGSDNLIAVVSRADRPSTAELLVAAIPAAAFYLIVLLKSISSLLLIGGTLVLIGGLMLVKRRRDTPPFAFEIFGVGMGSVVLLLGVWIFASKSSAWDWVAIAVASLAVQSLYATYRIPKGQPDARRSLLHNAVHGLKWGVGLSFVFTLMVVVFRGPIIAVVMMTSNQVSGAEGLVWVPVAYMSAGAIGGPLIGLLRGAARWPTGRVFLGLVGGMVTYGIIGALMPLMDPEQGPLNVLDTAAIAFGLGAIVGPATAFYWAELIVPDQTAILPRPTKTNRSRSSR